MNGLEENYGTEINFYRFDANRPENQRLQNSLQLRGHPSVALVNQEGEVVQRFFGAQSEEAILESLEAIRR